MKHKAELYVVYSFPRILLFFGRDNLMFTNRVEQNSLPELYRFLLFVWMCMFLSLAN